MEAADMAFQYEVQKIIVEKQLEFKIEQMKKQMDVQGEALQVEGRINVADIAAEAKVIAQQLAARQHVTGKVIDADAGIRKQEVANKKPKPKAA